MAEKASQRRHGGPAGRSAEHRLADDWPIYVAFLPAVLAAAAISISVLSAGCSRPNNPADTEIPVASDDYVEGLAKRGAQCAGFKYPVVEPRAAPQPVPIEPTDTAPPAHRMIGLVHLHGAC